MPNGRGDVDLVGERVPSGYVGAFRTGGLTGARRRKFASSVARGWLGRGGVRWRTRSRSPAGAQWGTADEFRTRGWQTLGGTYEDAETACRSAPVPIRGARGGWAWATMLH